MYTTKIKQLCIYRGINVNRAEKSFLIAQDALYLMRIIKKASGFSSKGFNLFPTCTMYRFKLLLVVPIDAVLNIAWPLPLQQPMVEDQIPAPFSLLRYQNPAVTPKT